MGHLLGMKAGLGLRGLRSSSLSHTLCVSCLASCFIFLSSWSLCISPHVSLHVSLHFSLPVSPRLCSHFSVLQHLEHMVTDCRKFGFPPAWRLIPCTTGSEIFSGDPRNPGGRKQDWNILWGPLEVDRGGQIIVKTIWAIHLVITQPHQVGSYHRISQMENLGAQKCAVTCPGSLEGKVAGPGFEPKPGGFPYCGPSHPHPHSTSLYPFPIHRD